MSDVIAKLREIEGMDSDLMEPALYALLENNESLRKTYQEMLLTNAYQNSMYVAVVITMLYNLPMPQYKIIPLRFNVSPNKINETTAISVGNLDLTNSAIYRFIYDSVEQFGIAVVENVTFMVYMQSFALVPPVIANSIIGVILSDVAAGINRFPLHPRLEELRREDPNIVLDPLFCRSIMLQVRSAITYMRIATENLSSEDIVYLYGLMAIGGVLCYFEDVLRAQGVTSFVVGNRVDKWYNNATAQNVVLNPKGPKLPFLQLTSNAMRSLDAIASFIDEDVGAICNKLEKTIAEGRASRFYVTSTQNLLFRHLAQMRFFVINGIPENIHTGVNDGPHDPKVIEVLSSTFFETINLCSV